MNRGNEITTPPCQLCGRTTNEATHDPALDNAYACVACQARAATDRKNAAARAEKPPTPSSSSTNTNGVDRSLERVVVRKAGGGSSSGTGTGTGNNAADGGHHPVEKASESGENDSAADVPEMRVLLADWRAGRRVPVWVPLGPIPDDAPPEDRDIAEDMRVRMGLMLAVHDYGPLMYARSEAVAAGHVHHKMQARRAIQRLVAAGVIVEAGSLPPRSGYPDGTRLYRAPTVAAAGDVFPPQSVPVEADLRRAVDQRQEVRDDAAVRRAVAEDPGELEEGGGRLGAAGDDTDRRADGGSIGHGPDDKGGIR